jgi:hypothetical protein
MSAPLHYLRWETDMGNIKEIADFVVEKAVAMHALHVK